MQRFRGNESGFSLIEVFVVLGFLMGMGLITLAVWSSNKDRFGLESGAESTNEILVGARRAAVDGAENPDARTVKVGDLKFPQGVQLVTDVSPQEFPQPVVILTAEDVLTFEPQTARTVDQKWGVIVLKDSHTGNSQALLVNYLNGPVVRFLKRAGDNQFRPMENAYF